MKIVYIVTRADEIGGVQIHVRDLGAALLARGHEVQILAGSGTALPEQLAARGVPFCEVPDLVRPIAPLSDLRAILQLRRQLRELGPDLVSTHSSKAGWLGRVAGRGLGIPILFTAHGWAFTEGVPGLQRRLYALAERLAAPFADHIVTVSDYDRRLALAYRVAPAAKLTRVHNGILDLADPPRDGPAPDPSRPPRLVMVGRFSEQKDQDTLLRALARLSDLPWSLDLVGGGPREPEVQALAAELGLAPRVRFLGVRDDVDRILTGADLFALISRWEGLPRSILEAMRNALPVVACDVGGVAEAVSEGETGFVVPPGDVDRLVARLRPLLGDPELRRRMGAAGRRRFEAGFRFEQMLDNTLAIYERMLAEAAPRRARGKLGVKA